MKKILIISFYELKEYLMYIKELFINYNYIVNNYPLFQYAYDTNDKLENYKEHMNNFITHMKPDVIIWWFLDVPSDVFKYIKSNNKSTYFIMFNFDDPCNFNTELLEKAKIFDLVLSPCMDNLHKYSIYSGVTNTKFMPIGYDPKYFYPFYDNPEKIAEFDDADKYTADISVLCYTLYDGIYYPDQQVTRKQLYTDIMAYCKKNKKTFKIYGSHALIEIFPENYVGDINYYNLNKVYNLSKLVINTHPHCLNYTAISDDMNILGSGALLLIDRVKNLDKILIDHKDCIVLKEGYIQQINHILNHYDMYKPIRKAGYETSKKYTWDNLIEQIHIEITKHFFDPALYLDNYNINLDRELIQDPFEHFKTVGVKNNFIGFSYDVPETFRFKDYIEEFNLNSTSKHRAYLHWYLNGRNTDYLKDKSTNNSIGNIENYNTNIEQWFMINSALYRVSDYRTRDIGLVELGSLCKNNPKIKINDLINIFFDFFNSTNYNTNT
jgi:hypothetical protein